MSKSLISTAITTNVSVTADTPLTNLGAIIRRTGCDLFYEGINIKAKSRGFYTISVTATALPKDTGNITMTIVENGNPVSGANATSSVATAGTPVNLTIADYPTRVFCGEPQNISVQFSADCTLTNMVVTVKRWML